MNPNSTWAYVPGVTNQLYVYGYVNGTPQWIRITYPGIVAAFQNGTVNYNNLNDGSWQQIVMGSAPPAPGVFSYPVPPPQNAVQGPTAGGGANAPAPVFPPGFVPGSGQTTQALAVQAPPQGQLQQQSAQQGSGGGYIQGQQAGISTALVAQLLTGQQTAAAAAAIMGQGASDVAAAATADDLSAGMLTIISGVSMSVGINASTGQSSLLSSPNGILFALLGAQGVTNLGSIVVSAAAVLDLASTTTAALSGAAWDKFVSDVGAVLSQVQTNQLLGSLAGGGNVGTGALLGILMGQQALATFVAQSKTGTASTTVATAQANVAKFTGAFQALMAALNTNNLLLALVPN